MIHQFEILSGKKIFLQRFDESCISDKYLSWLIDPKVVRFSNQRFVNHTPETSKKYLASFSGTDNLFLAVRLKDDEKMVGTINTYVSSHHGTADIGIMIGDRTCWGQGIGLDAWVALMEYLFSKCKSRKITGGTVRSNKGMVKIMERSGMHLEAVREQQQVFDGEALDVLYYAKFYNE